MLSFVFIWYGSVPTKSVQMYKAAIYYGQYLISSFAISQLPPN